MGKRSSLVARAKASGRRVAVGSLAVVMVALGLVVLAPVDRAEAGPAPVMTGFVPMPADDYQALFESINTAADTTLDYTVGITNAGDGAVMYYDHWEDGYEADIANPVQSTTEIWGDGNVANGDAGAAGRCGARCAGDLLTPGDVFVLRNNITTPRNASQIRFDGRDKIASTRGFSTTVGTWTTPLGSVLAGSVAAYDTTKYGTSFVLPVGQDTGFTGNDPFEFVGASIMAASDNTVVQVDTNADGTFDTTQTINQGQTALVNGGLNQGARIVTSKPVQAHVVTGDVSDTYESRSYILLPLSLLSNDYMNPVGSNRSGYQTVVYLYNPNPSTITIDICTANPCPTPTSLVLNANTSGFFLVPLGLGSRFVSQGGEKFEAFAATGARASNNNASATYSANWDWGNTLIPTNQLTTQAVLAWAPGDSGNPPGNDDYNPVWVTSLNATTVRVDFDGDPTTGAIAGADCFGARHDLDVAVTALESQRITDPNDSDMTGSRIYTCDGNKIAAAWGEDPSTASTGSPGLDAGYTIIPSTTMVVNKTGGLFTDTNGDGKFGPGDVIEYTIAIADAGSLAFTSVNAQDTLPPGVSYVPGSTVFDNGVVTPIADDAVPPAASAFPLDETGAALPSINAGQTVFLRFKAAIDNPRQAAGTIIANTVCVTAAEANACDTEETPLADADLSLTKTLLTPPTLVGTNGTFRITVANAGPDSATGVEVTDLLPAGLAFQSSTPSQGAYNSGTGIWTVGTLASGGSATLDITAQVNVASATNFAQITKAQAADPDSQPAENPLGVGNPPDQDDEASAAVTATPLPNLNVTKSDGGGSTTPGGTVAYTLSYANAGPGAATGVALTETVPANTTFNAGASTGAWSCANGSIAGTTCTLSIGSLASGANGSATFAVTVVNPVPAGVNQVANSVTIGSTEPDGDPTDNTGTDTTPVTAAPDLSIAKSDGGVSTTPGGTVAYTLSYANSGNQGATGVVLSETVPANSSFNAGASSAGWVCTPNGNAGSTCTLTIGSLAAGASGSRTFAVTTVNPLPAGVTQLANTATVADDGTNGTDPTPGNNTSSDTTPVTAAPDLTVTKSDGGATATPGGTVTYGLSFANNGNQGATGVVLTETVPANSTFKASASSGGWSCADGSAAGTTCTLNLGNVGAGTAGLVQFAVTVVSPLPAGVTQIANTVTIADDGTNGPDPTPANNTSSDTTPVTAAPDLTITKSDGGATTAPGDTVAYALGYANVGNQDATGVVLSETVPANSSFNAGASTAGWSCTPDGNAGSTCTLAIGPLAAGANGSATFAVTVVSPLPAGQTQLANTATVADDGTNGADPTPANNTASDTTPVTAAPDLTITKSDGGASAVPGGTVSYTLSYANVGNQGATGVVLSETVPANSSFNAGASSAGWVCTPNGNAGSTCTLTIGSLAAGASGSRTFAVTVVNPLPAGVTQIANTATVADDGTNGPDPTPANNTSSDTTPVTAAPDLTITKSDGGASTAPGGTVTYTLGYANVGNQDATGVALTETVPANSSFNAGASTGGWSCTPDGNAGSTCTLAIGNLAAGANGTATFAVTVVNPLPAGVTQIANTATVADDGTNGTDPTPANNTSSDTTPINAAPDLTITKSDGGASTTPGGTVTYTLGYANAGNQGATGVALTETVPANSSFNAGASTAGWSCTPNGNAGSTCTLTIGNLAAGANGSATFAVTTADPVPAGVTQIANTATVADDGTNGTDPTPGNNTAGDTTPIAAAPDLTITKSDGGASTTPGGTVSYTLGFANAGNKDATGVALTETVPANSSFNAGASTAGWSCTPNGNAGSTCTLAIGPLAAGANGSATFAVNVANPLPAGVTQIANTATIGDDGTNGADPTPGNNTSSDTTPVTAAPDLSITKSDGGATTTPGGTVAYTLSYANNGNQGATGVVLSETVPANSSFNAGASSAGWVCTPNGNAGSTCTLTIGSLASGASGSRTFAVTVVNPLPAGVTQIANTATVADDGTNGPDPTPGDNTGSDTTPITAAPDLTITKSDGGASTTPGGTVAYTLSYANNGNKGATGVVLSETVPANSTFNAGASTAGWSCTPNNAAGSTCTLAIGNVAAGANGTATFAVTTTDPLPAGVAQLTNTATVADDGTNGPDPTPANNTSTDTTPANSQADLSLTKTVDDDTPLVGANVTFTVTVSNAGPNQATGVVVGDLLPIGLSLVGSTTSQGSYDGNTGVWTVGTLANGGSATLTITATVLQPGTIQNFAQVTASDMGDPDSQPNENPLGVGNPPDQDDEGTAGLSVVDLADVAVTKTDGQTETTPGGLVTYTIGYGNNGPSTATSVVLSETVPAGSTFVAGSSTAGWSCTPNADAGSTCTLAVGSLANGASGTATFALRVAFPLPSGQTNLSNTVTVATSTPESTTTNNTATDVDAIATGTVGDTVFVDANGNSTPDPGEGLVGVAVRVTWPGPDGTLGNGDDVQVTTTTGVDGLWTVTGLPAGSLQVQVDTSTLPGGIVNTVDPDGGNDSTSSVTLPAGGTDLKQDFGYRGNAVIGDRVWDDLNANGIQDPGEPGHPGVTVELLDGGGSVIDATVTDASGLYQFADLVPGDYEIRVTAPSGTVFAKPDAGVDDTVDSDVAVATGRTGTFFLSGGAEKTDVDAALVAPSTLSGSVFADADDDGVVDPGEPGIAGVTVTLTGTDDLGNPVNLTTTTAADGSYSFADLRPGTYAVTETQPAGFLDGKDTAGTAGGTVGADTVTGIVLVSGTDASGYLFAEVSPASLAGFVINDLNGNGAVDPGEPGIGSVTITLTGADSQGNPVNRVLATAADGSYTFGQLRPGTYALTETQPAGFLDGADLVGSLGGTVGADAVTGIVVPAGGAGGGYRFLEVAPSSIGDRVWRDVDGDTVQDAGETGLPGVTVRLFADLDTNGSFETPVGATTTAADGSYAFANLPVAAYQVQVDATTAPAGYTATTPTSFDRSITVGGTTVTDADAGFQPPPGSIGDTVFLDLNGNGTQDPGEPGLPGVTVTLQDSGGATITATTTDGSGTYQFAGLAAADYKVVVTPPAGFATSSPASLDRTLAEGASVVDADFAILGATIGDRVWDDTNGNGIQDSGEPGHAGVTVELLDGGGNVVTSTTTDATGTYSFAGRAAGDYEVRVTAPAGSLFAKPDAGADDAVDSDVAVLTGRTGVFAVAAGATDTSRDAGLVPPASLAGRVFADPDNDGVVDPGENGIAGTTVTLTGTDDLGNPVSVTATTAADGTYSFANLRPGTYTVTETQPAGFLDGKDTAGTGGGTVGADSVSGVVLGAGQSVGGYLFAELLPSSMTGRVWNDLDDDGVADPGEPGIAGVTVTLTGTDDLGPVTRTATTAADGGYAFTNLRPGTYTITETQPSTFLDGQDAVGTLGGTLGNDSISGIVVPTGTAGASYLFGEVAPVSIGDRVWSDTNGDGVQDPGENGLPGITVTLRQDVDGDGTYETAVGTDVTDANGLYLFEQLRPGRYRVAVDATTVPAEVTATTPANQDRVTTGGQSVTDADFGFLPAPPPSGSIGDRVWSDTDGDGVQDAAEPGLGGVLVTLLRDADSNGSYETTVGSAITTGAGDYHFTGLEAGAYRVVVTAPSGQTPTTSETIDIALAHRQVVDTADFGYRPPAPPPPASIGDRVWDDVDGDGVQDPGEAGLSGVTVTLRQDTDGNGSFETEAATQVTGADGAYQFANLPVGSYRVVVTVPSGRSATTPTAVSANLTGGQVVDTADFGLRTTAPAAGSIGDRVWDDVDGDGVQDPGEAGIDGAIVTLLRDVDGDGVFETTIGPDDTDATGTYGFAGLPPGSYRVVVSPPNGYSPTTPTIVPVELTAGEVVTDADFGIRQAAPATGTIGDRVWSDTDRDGVQDAGEPGLNGVTVVLLKDTDGDGTYETTVSTQNTAGDGGYHFTDVPAGAYLVRVTPPAGQSPTTPSSVPVALAAGQVVDDADVGMATPPSIPFDLALTKSLEAPMVAGGEATWVLDIRNNGIAPSPNPVTVTDVLPTGITYKGFTGTGWSCSASGQTVTCTLPQSIGVGGTTQLKIVTTVATTPGVEVTNNATVSAEGVEVTLANNADDAVGSIQPIPTTTTTGAPTTTTSTSTTLPPVSITISPTTTVVTATTSTGSLPQTGSDTWRLALVAMGLVGAGSLLLLWRRRLQG